MFFTLEALSAKKGDSILIHCGTRNDPALLVIDGGPSGVYKQSLDKRLRALASKRTPNDSLPIRLLMVSHIDDDHIKGILDLTNKLREQKADRQPQSYRIEAMWHNTFDDVIGNHPEVFVTAASTQVGEASLLSTFPEDLPVSPYAGLVLASVPQGRELRDNARLLGIDVNHSMDKLVVAPDDGSAVDPPIAEGLETLVLAPSKQRVVKFQKEWDDQLKERGLDKPEEVEVAAYLDKSVYNLASIVVLLRSGGKEMLLTGDARGDDILTGMKDAGLLDGNGKRHVDLLKLPHHGSDRNVETDFFRKITADHYVISGDGSHGNPEPHTFQMLFDGRRDDDRSFTLYLTHSPEDFRPHRGKDYPIATLQEILDDEKQTGRPFNVVTPQDDAISVKVDLLDDFPD